MNGDNKQKNMKENKIDELVNFDFDAVSAPALKLALELHRKEQAEREAKNALVRIQQIENLVQRNVYELREVRKLERKQKDNLEKLIAAKEQFYKDGNWENFCNTLKNQKITTL